MGLFLLSQCSAVGQPRRNPTLLWPWMNSRGGKPTRPLPEHSLQGAGLGWLRDLRKACAVTSRDYFSSSRHFHKNLFLK